jgi:hypothetical protein
MRNLGIAAVIVFVLASAGAALADDESAPRSGEHGSSRAIIVQGKTAQLNLVDSGEPGFTLGDQVAFSDDLFGKTGKPAGVDGGACTLVRIADAASQSGTAQCDVTYSLADGQISTQGLLELTNGGFVGTQSAAITGGTGRYRDARGESTLQFIRPGELMITLAVKR